MYITKSNKEFIVVELGGFQVTREALEALKEELDLKTDREAEEYLQSIADGAVRNQMERFN
jgi:DNA topoisomerase IA